MATQTKLNSFTTRYDHLDSFTTIMIEIEKHLKENNSLQDFNPQCLGIIWRRLDYQTQQNMLIFFK